MKNSTKILILTAGLTVALQAQATWEQEATQQQGQSQDQQQYTNSEATATVSSGDQYLSNNIENPDSLTIRNTPSMVAPNLVTSNDTCVTSAAGSISLPGFGFSIGNGEPEKNCVMLKNARELWNMSHRKAALALMCNDVDNRYALENTGYKCPAAREKNSWISRLFGAKTYKDEEVGIQGRVHGSGDSEETVQHIPQYMPYYPTSASIWPRTIDVNCKEVGDDLDCEGYNWKPEMGRTEYLFINPKIAKEPAVGTPKEVPVIIVPHAPDVSKPIVKKPRKVYKQIKKGCSV